MPTQDTYERIIWSADVSDDTALLDKLHRIEYPIRVKIDRLYIRHHAPQTVSRRLIEACDVMLVGHQYDSEAQQYLGVPDTDDFPEYSFVVSTI